MIGRLSAEHDFSSQLKPRCQESPSEKVWPLFAVNQNHFIHDMCMSMTHYKRMCTLMHSDYCNFFLFLFP